MILDLTELKQKFNLADIPVSIVGNGTTATCTISSGHNFKSGDYLNIDGTTHFDGVKLITRTSTTTFTFASTGSYTESGYIKQYDTMLTRLISQVENHIKNFCDIEYGNVEEATEKYDLGVNAIILPKRGLITEEDIAEIKLSRENDFSTSGKYITLSESDYFVYDDRIELKFDKVYSYLNCRKAVQLTYTTQDCPDGLKSIAEQIAEFYFRIWNDKSIAENSRSNNGDQVVFSKKLPDYLVEELSKYQRISIGDPY